MFRSLRRRTPQHGAQPSAPRYHLMTDEQLTAIGALYPRQAREYCLVFWLTNPDDPERCCQDCAAVADRSPYSAPESRFNPLNQTPGDGSTRCGAGCSCVLSYMDMATGLPKESWAPLVSALPPVWLDHQQLYYRLTWRQRRYVNQYGYELTPDTKPEAVPEWKDDDA